MREEKRENELNMDGVLPVWNLLIRHIAKLFFCVQNN